MIVPMIALRGMTVFPEMLLHFDIGRDKSVKALEEALQNQKNVFLIAQNDVRIGDPAQSDLCSTGTIAQIRQLLRLPGDTVRVLVEGTVRARLLDIVKQEPFMLAEVEAIAETGRGRVAEKRVEALVRSVRGAFEQYITLAPRLSPEILLNVLASDSPGYLADYIAQSTPIPFTDKQAILEEIHPARRLEKMLSILTRENGILEIEADLQTKVRDQISKNQRDYFLREQMKTIREELGDDEGGGETEADGYREKIVALSLAEETQEKLLHEAGRLSHMNAHSPEYALIRAYLDTALELPWNIQTKDRLDIAAARRILDRDHYGLQKVKERVLEYLAVKRLAPELKGQILCLVGPPGVGKTSVALSVAEALKRKSARLSLGGVRDEADIRGHRKTYIGAMPGRVINAMRQAKSRNAVLLLDEIDKLSSDFRGDPSAALLEVLDPEQNFAFRDHYLEVPFDLSEVLFITTANTTDTIPRALLDRMEVIEITSYTDEEKLQIVKRHLLPKQLKRHGLKKAQLSFTDPAIRELIAGYTRESGVRNLEREIAAACRKAAKRIAEGGEQQKRPLAPKDLEPLLGVRKYKPERLRGEDEIGVANGLAWTRVGGELLEVEVGVVDGTGKVELTGNMGDIMKESARAALTYIRSRASALKLDPEFHKNKDMHIHFPESAVPKDGPSAGITMAVAMVSALCGAPVYRNVAMTGEITLRGRVLPIGGLKEKTMAAYRAGIKTVIIPSDNESDLQDIDPTVHSALNFICADHMDTVLKNTVDFTRVHES